MSKLVLSTRPICVRKNEFHILRHLNTLDTTFRVNRATAAATTVATAAAAAATAASTAAAIDCTYRVMIEVAVIGAGSAGLVTARHLLANGLKCCIFEATSTLGGAWSCPLPPSATSIATATMNDGNGMMWKGLNTNLSKHTCRFSDFPWPDDTPTFPSKEDMDRYLTSYANEFIIPGDPNDDGDNRKMKSENKNKREREDGIEIENTTWDSSCSFLYDCKVTKISPIVGTSHSHFEEHQQQQQQQQYRVEWTDSVHQTKHSKEFGGVVVATGFFSKPKYPSGLLPEIIRRKNDQRDKNINDSEINNKNSETNNSSNNKGRHRNRIQIVHSKDYVYHDELVGEKNEKVVVVGSSHSALEIAVDVSKSVGVDVPITVIMPKIPWVAPRYVPACLDHAADTNAHTSVTASFLPIDLAFYRRRKRHDKGSSSSGNDESSGERTSLTPESCRKRHKDLRAMLGPKQEQILPVPPACFEKPPMVAVSDYFLDLVAGGKIEVVRGRVEGITDDGKGLRISRVNGSISNTGTDNINVSSETDVFVLPGVTSLICCTGYLPDLESCCGALEFESSEAEDDSSSLPSSILRTVDYDPTDSFSPMTTHLETLHPKLANFAFVGMYRGPYMGVVELQARLAAGVISGKVEIPPEDFEKGLETCEKIRNPDPFLRPQFPRFDYVGFMDSLAGFLSLSKSKAIAEEGDSFPNQKHLMEGSMVTPAFYQPDQSLVDLARNELDQEIEKGTNGCHLPRVVASALVGSWSFERNILHFSDGGKTIALRQYIHGKVRYSRSRDLGHVLYREDGFFDISESKSLPVFREYEYVCTRDEEGGGGALELYFVEDGKRTYIFLSLKFQHQDKDGYWVATNDHLCIKDLYKANFQIKLDGLAATEVIITYRVKGPAKDYESTTIMRPQYK